MTLIAGIVVGFFLGVVFMRMAYPEMAEADTYKPGQNWEDL
jgi:hypothetical protein